MASGNNRTTVKRAFIVGMITIVPLVIFGWILYWFVRVNSTIWDFLMKKMPIVPAYCQEAIGIFFTVVIVIVIGSLVIRLGKKLIKWPLFGLLLGSSEILGKGVSGDENQSKRQVVLARYGGAWFFGVFTETVVIQGETLYRVTALGAPAPVTAQLLIVSKDDILFSNMKMPDLFSLLASFGFRSLKNFNFLPPRSDQDK